MPDTLTHLINGEDVNAGPTCESINPSNLDDVVARYPKGSPEQVNDAVKVSHGVSPLGIR